MPGFSKSFLFLDVNVWVALTWEGHVHHATAVQWFKTLDAAARFAFCRFTQISLLRLLTTRAVMGGDVLSQSEAWEAYDRWMLDDRVFFLEEPLTLEASFRALSRRTRADSKIWADAYLAAFAAVTEMRLVTFDRGFKAMADGLVLLKT